MSYVCMYIHTRMYLSGKKIDGVISFVELCTETAAKVAEGLRLPC
jgi:hypothetical protein